ncbi:senescence/dehydration-associated protein At3g51250-like [Andrographis paniculata]|uniref:senescence/dehydration-associated protein At3g51250-like n=1 Tax=Andrographis paniculata TaxID=175694 RepID=UPI0021E7B456|nr:senescence/dehydration-associated protein At3g51250-like [Andrographis paniculata]
MNWRRICSQTPKKKRRRRKAVEEMARSESSEEVIVRDSPAGYKLIEAGDTIVAALVRIGDEIQWPMAKDEAAVKLDVSHYFFTRRVPAKLTDGLTVAAKGQEGLVEKLDSALEKFSAFRVEKASAAAVGAEWGSISGGDGCEQGGGGERRGGVLDDRGTVGR